MVEGERIVAMVVMGYADGLLCLFFGCGEVFFCGWCVFIVGVVSMDLIVVDVMGIEGACVGDEVVFFGS